MALDTFNPYLFVSSGEQSNKFLTPTYADGIAQFQAQRAQQVTKLLVQIDPVQEGTGDPSPDNIRPISGRTGLTATVQSGETQNEYPVTWQTEAGTIYGGTLDVVSGELIVTHGLVAFDGSENWVLSNPSSAGCYVQFNDLVRTNNYIGKILCDKLSTFSTFLNDDYKLAEYGITAYGKTTFPNQNWIYAKNEQTPTVASFKAWLSENPITICYYLATPQTYQLSPEDVKTLAGFNQVYSNAGPVIGIKF